MPMQTTLAVPLTARSGFSPSTLSAFGSLSTLSLSISRSLPFLLSACAGGGEGDEIGEEKRYPKLAATAFFIIEGGLDTLRPLMEPVPELDTEGAGSAGASERGAQWKVSSKDGRIRFGLGGAAAFFVAGVVEVPRAAFLSEVRGLIGLEPEPDAAVEEEPVAWLRLTDCPPLDGSFPAAEAVFVTGSERTLLGLLESPLIRSMALLTFTGFAVALEVAGPPGVISEKSISMLSGSSAVAR